MAIAAEQLSQAILIRFKRKFRDGITAGRTSPVPLVHNARTSISSSAIASSVVPVSSLLPVAIAAEQLSQALLVRLKRKFGNGTSASGTFPITLVHLTGKSPVVVIVRHFK
ncbi:MAG: hypothetical protein WCV87_03895 [Candidatus Paceibacterota bacterium]